MSGACIARFWGGLVVYMVFATSLDCYFGFAISPSCRLAMAYMPLVLLTGSFGANGRLHLSSGIVS